MSFGSHSIIYLDNGDLLACGWNNKGQLGLRDKINRSELVFMKNELDIDMMACSFDTTFLLKSNGKLYGVGSSEYGQMGTGNFDFTLEFQLILEDVSDIYCGYRFVITKMRDGSVMSFGRNDVGQLGINTTNHTNIPKQVFDVENKIKMISCGGTHTVFLKERGDVLVCGWNSFGQLGTGDTTNVNSPRFLMNDPDIVNIFCGGNYTFILKKTILIGFGENKWGQLALPEVEKQLEHTVILRNHQIRMISCGGGHTLMLQKNGDLLVCGKNDKGQLGLGHTKNQTTLQLLMVDVDIISTGDAHSYVIQRSSKNNEKVFVFGDGSGGRLGVKMPDEQPFITKPTLLDIYSNIKLLPKIRRHMFGWTPDDHLYFKTDFQNQVLYLLLFLKYNYKVTNLKIPKFIIYEIIKKID